MKGLFFRNCIGILIAIIGVTELLFWGLRQEYQAVAGGNSLNDWVFVVVIGGAFILVSIISYLLVLPLQNRLRNMEEAVKKIRRGNLNARVIVEGNDALSELGDVLNDLVEHVQRLIDSQRELMRAVSHELRTPVARIRFGLEMVCETNNASKREAQIKEIDHDIEALNGLIDEILTYAALEEGTLSLNFEWVNIDSVLDLVKKEADALGTNIQIEKVTSKQPEELRNSECEERYIHRAIQNLVNNALRYAESKVRISASCEGEMYRVDVEDDGPGIPQDKWEKVFVPFARLDDSRTRASGGYGLGLSIVQRIVYWHGGVASVYRSQLGGAKFTVIWPRQQSLRKRLDFQSNSNVTNSLFKRDARKCSN